MGIQINWYNAEQTILKYEFEGKWTWHDLDEAVQKVNEMLASVPHPVHILIQFHGGLIPNGALSQMRIKNSKPEANWGGGVFVGVHPLLRVLVTTFLRLYPPMAERYAVAETEDEALAIIQKWQHAEAAN